MCILSCLLFAFLLGSNDATFKMGDFLNGKEVLNFSSLL
jgi:phosphate/sulfate permease